MTLRSQKTKPPPGRQVEGTRTAKLHYIQDHAPGFTRQRYRGKFKYLDHEGQCIVCEQHLARIHALRIPPAWQSVWICAHPHGHLQATGRDAKGRKQYLYHAEWRKQREARKYEHMVAFGLQLPTIRQQVARDLKATGLGKQKVLAMMIRLLENTLIRIGNDEYARTNQSFGLTTLRNRHVAIEDNDVEFHFRGKSGVEHRVRLHDRRLARMLRHLRELPGQALFQYVDEQGVRHAIGSAEVNDYLRQITGDDYTAKDFRTWFGSLHVLQALSDCPPFCNEAEAKKQVVVAIRQAASRLGNTPAICRQSYVHPWIIERYLAGGLQPTLAQDEEAQKEDKQEKNTVDEKHGLSIVERNMLDLLQHR
jgi:DNA topoisomerase-1